MIISKRSSPLRILFGLKSGVKWFASSKTPVIEIIHSNSKDIHFNIATEEFLFDHSEINHPTLFLWQNDKTVVIGRHQNPWKECHLQAMEKDGVKLARRRSGGGAVYQDLGNSCWSFFTNVRDDVPPLGPKDDNNVILLQALADIGIPGTELQGRNDILLKGKKISGSAFKVNIGKTDGSNRKTLHHGTMLLNVDTSAVQKYLNPNKKKLQSKGIDSVVQRIMNLSEVQPSIDHSVLCRTIAKSFTRFHDPQTVIEKHLDHQHLQENKKIQSIYDELRSSKWIFEHSPNFTNNLETRLSWGMIDLYLSVENNVIMEGKAYSDCLFPDFIEEINTAINTKKNTYNKKGVDAIEKALIDKFSQKPEFVEFSKELCAWLASSL